MALEYPILYTRFVVIEPPPIPIPRFFTCKSLNRAVSEARRMSKKHKCSVSVQSIPSYQILEHKFFDSEGDEIDLR
jgi:hypothetical protein